jgi:hypothetical protein
MAAVAPETLDDEDRVSGGWASQQGPGSRHHRLASAIVLNLVLLLLFDHANFLSWTAATTTTHSGGGGGAGAIVVLGALVGWLLYQGAFALVQRKYRRIVGKADLTPNVSVVVPNPQAALKGHPKHLYYTIPYDVSRGSDLMIHGFKRGDFAYTSVKFTCPHEIHLPEHLLTH